MTASPFSDTPAQKLKAYEVREPEEGSCTVVFDTRNVSARRRGAAELGCDFEDVESCVRRPEFDQYDPGPVPLSATLAAGWWHTCCGCGCTFDNDGIRAYDEDSVYHAIEPVEDKHGSTFCSPACMMRDWQQKRERKLKEAAVIEVAMVKWPEALRVWPYCRSRSEGTLPNACDILLPGMADPISWEIGGTHAGVTRRDLDTFKRLYGPKDGLALAS